jgi:hypothetical protein
VDYRRRVISTRLPRFQGTRELKFSLDEQAAIRAAERAFGYEPQHQAPAAHHPPGLGWLFPVAAAVFLLFMLLAAVATLIDARLSPPAHIQAASATQSAGSEEVSPGPTLRHDAPPISQAAEAIYPSPPGTPQVSPTVVYTNEGGRIIAVTRREPGSPSSFQSAASTKTEADQQFAEQPLALQMSAAQDEESVDHEAASQARPAPAIPPWHKFGPPQPIPPASTWRRFEQPQAKSPSVKKELAREPFSVQESRKSRRSHHTNKKRGLLRRTLGGVGRALKGTAQELFRHLLQSQAWPEPLQSALPAQAWPPPFEGPAQVIAQISLQDEQKGGRP